MGDMAVSCLMDGKHREPTPSAGHVGEVTST